MEKLTVRHFLQKIKERNEFQSKFLENLALSAAETVEFEYFLNFYHEILGKTLNEMVDDYLFLNRMVQEETYYFVWNGKYRHSTLGEVENYVYHNREYMEKYMIGLSISEFLWYPHLEMIRYYMKNISRWGGNYLEIGPGSGQYLIKALRSGCFSSCTACDISETSVELTNQLLNYIGIEEQQCRVEQKNFFDYEKSAKFNTIVMGEVLEHVEEPKSMLMKIRDLLADDGTAFITTVINGPTIDHIFLFESEKAVLDMVKESGFTIEDYICVTAGGIPIEKAVKKKMAIDIALILRMED